MCLVVTVNMAIAFYTIFTIFLSEYLGDYTATACKACTAHTEEKSLTDPWKTLTKQEHREGSNADCENFEAVKLDIMDALKGWRMENQQDHDKLENLLQQRESRNTVIEMVFPVVNLILLSYILFGYQTIKNCCFSAMGKYGPWGLSCSPQGPDQETKTENSNKCPKYQGHPKCEGSECYQQNDGTGDENTEVIPGCMYVVQEYDQGKVSPQDESTTFDNKIQNDLTESGGQNDEEDAHQKHTEIKGTDQLNDTSIYEQRKSTLGSVEDEEFSTKFDADATNVKSTIPLCLDNPEVLLHLNEVDTLETEQDNGRFDCAVQITEFQDAIVFASHDTGTDENKPIHVKIVNGGKSYVGTVQKYTRLLLSCGNNIRGDQQMLKFERKDNGHSETPSNGIKQKPYTNGGNSTVLSTENQSGSGRGSRGQSVIASREIEVQVDLPHTGPLTNVSDHIGEYGTVDDNKDYAGKSSSSILDDVDNTLSKATESPQEDSSTNDTVGVLNTDMSAQGHNNLTSEFLVPSTHHNIRETSAHTNPYGTITKTYRQNDTIDDLEEDGDDSISDNLGNTNDLMPTDREVVLHPHSYVTGRNENENNIVLHQSDGIENMNGTASTICSNSSSSSSSVTGDQDVNNAVSKKQVGPAINSGMQELLQCIDLRVDDPPGPITNSGTPIRNERYNWTNLNSFEDIPQTESGNRPIYAQLRRMDAVLGYFSSGDSIEVYIDTQMTEPETLLLQLCQITGEGPEKFHIKDNTEQW